MSEECVGPQSQILSWEDFFMASAFLAAQRSKDPVTKVGACIVDEMNHIVGVGYNGFPNGCSDNDFPWGKTSPDILERKYMYVVHAEANAILNKNSTNINGCKIFVALFPCNECAKLIIQSGIKEVVYLSDKHRTACSTIAAKRLFDAAGIKYRQYIPKVNEIVINFTNIDWNQQVQISTPDKNNCLSDNSLPDFKNMKL